MIITKTTPYTPQELDQFIEDWRVYVKVVVDLKNRSCSAGAETHDQLISELLSLGSSRLDLWGGGYDLETSTVDTLAEMNFRPEFGNSDTRILDPLLKDQFESLIKYFFSNFTPPDHV